MPTSMKRTPTPRLRKPLGFGDGRSAKQHSVPTSSGEKHLGATEDQVSATMPPKADDDEPKQG
jgi:hypothetical protein